MEGPVAEIVGVAASVPQIGFDSPPLPEIYLPAAQRVDAAMVVMIRTRGNPESMIATVRQTLASIDANVPIQSLKTADTWLGATLVQRRFTTILLVLFAGIAVMLASIGCYGVFNYWVSCRRQEIAIRMAMGAGTIAIYPLHRKANREVRLNWFGRGANRKLGRITLAEQPGLRSLHTRPIRFRLRRIRSITDRPALRGGSPLARHANRSHRSPSRSLTKTTAKHHHLKRAWFAKVLIERPVRKDIITDALRAYGLPGIGPKPQ